MSGMHQESISGVHFDLEGEMEGVVAVVMAAQMSGMTGTLVDSQWKHAHKISKI
jgi:hypothetical protein